MIQTTMGPLFAPTKVLIYTVHHSINIGQSDSGLKRICSLIWKVTLV